MEAGEEMTEDIKFWFFTDGFFIWSCATLLSGPFASLIQDPLVYLLSFLYLYANFPFTCKVPSADGWRGNSG